MYPRRRPVLSRFRPTRVSVSGYTAASNRRFLTAGSRARDPPIVLDLLLPISRFNTIGSEL